MVATCGWVDAGCDVEVTQSVGMGKAVAAWFVAVVPPVQVGQAACNRGMGHAMERRHPIGVLQVELEQNTPIN
jgi:hypothetical protein